MRPLLLVAMLTILGCSDANGPKADHTAATMLLASPSDTTFGTIFNVRYAYLDRAGDTTRTCAGSASPDAVTWSISGVARDTVTVQGSPLVADSAGVQAFHVTGPDTAHMSVTATAACGLDLAAHPPAPALVRYGPVVVGLDPTVLVRNATAGRAYFYWQSGTDTLGIDTIPGATTRCERFLAIADSANWSLYTDTTSAGYAWVKSNYFDPTTRPAWTADIRMTPNPVILQADTTAEC